jgi:3-hydroxyisobutyrate dehydrogenase-like beta-hydroxyacid dehydrogenase
MNSVELQQREQAASAGRVALLGLGEAGGRLATDLVAAGVEVRGYDPDPGRSVPAISRAPDPESAGAGCDVVLSVNSARAALDAAHDLLLEPGVEPLIATASAAQLADLAATKER